MSDRSLISAIEMAFNQLLDEGDKLSSELTDSVIEGFKKLTQEATTRY